MDDAAHLLALETRRDTIARGIQNIDLDIAGAEDALVKGEPPARLVHFLRERNEALRGQLQDLGAIEARIEDVKLRLAERDREAGERQTAAVWDRKDPAPDADREWYKRPQAREPVRTREPGAKERDWFVRDRENETPEEPKERYNRER